MDLRTILEQEHLAVILRMRRVLNHEDVADELELPLALPHHILFSIHAAVPELGIVLANRAGTREGRQAVLNEP